MLKQPVKEKSPQEVPPEYADLLFSINEAQVTLRAIASFIQTRTEATPTYNQWIRTRVEFVSDKVAAAKEAINGQAE